MTEKDFIDQTLDLETQMAIERYQKKLEYKIMLGNKKRKENKKKRKLERNNRRNGRK